VVKISFQGEIKTHLNLQENFYLLPIKLTPLLECFKMKWWLRSHLWSTNMIRQWRG